MKKLLTHTILVTLLLLSCASARAQFLDSTTGLLQMPTAVMNREGTFMVTTNYLNQHTLSPKRWNYNTIGYGFSLALWDRVEVAYVCVLMHGTYYYSDQPEPEHWKNQDRHFSAKVLLLREGDFGLKWMPAFAVGVCDPTTGSGGGYETGVSTAGNGFFNRYYAVASKRFETNVGEVSAHVGYQFNRRTDIPMNAPCAGVNWKPVWIQTNWLSLDLIAEYNSRTFNVGFIASLWDDHLEAMFELQALKWVSFGLRYKMRLRD